MARVFASREGCADEEDRLPVVRTLDAVAPLAGAHGGGLAAPVDRAGRGRRGVGRRRRLLPRAPLRPAARLAVPAPRGHRCAHQQDRDWHGRHRHALREPAVYGRGRGGGGHHRAGPAPTGHQPRVAGAGDRRLAPFRLCPLGGRDGRRYGPPARRGLPGDARGPGVCPAQPAPDVPQPARAAARRAPFGRAARPDSGGAPARTPRPGGPRGWE